MSFGRVVNELLNFKLSRRFFFHTARKFLSSKPYKIRLQADNILHDAYILSTQNVLDKDVILRDTRLSQNTNIFSNQTCISLNF